MSKFDFSALEGAAVSNNFKATPSRTPSYELAIEDAREKVKVRDGNKVANEDGSQALTLTFSKYVLPLDVIKAGATRVNATAEQVEDYSKVLLEAVQAGQFDAEIVEAQGKARAAAEKRDAAPAKETTTEEATEEAGDVDGLDLDEL